MLKLRGISVILFLIILQRVAPAQTLDYSQVFGDDWKKAEAFESENRYWLKPAAEETGLPYHVVMAVVFPELVRYSALRDKMETTLLKALYVNLGDDYANFSIGHFQVKPSFASEVRGESAELFGKRSHIKFSQPDDYEDITNYRKSIVVDLEDPKTEFSYIVAFFRICEKKFKTKKMNEEEQVKFLSTAYNYGIDKSAGQISEMIDRKFFTTKIFKSVTYCYSDISLYWYRGQKGMME